VGGHNDEAETIKDEQGKRKARSREKQRARGKKSVGREQEVGKR